MARGAKRPLLERGRARRHHAPDGAAPKKARAEDRPWWSCCSLIIPTRESRYDSETSYRAPACRLTRVGEPADTVYTLNGVCLPSSLEGETTLYGKKVSFLYSSASGTPQWDFEVSLSKEMHNVTPSALSKMRFRGESLQAAAEMMRSALDCTEKPLRRYGANSAALLALFGLSPSIVSAIVKADRQVTRIADFRRQWQISQSFSQQSW